MMEKEYAYLVTEWNDALGPFGSIIGVFTNIELINSALTSYFGAVLLFYGEEPVTTEDIERLLLVIDPSRGDECLIPLTDNNGNAAMIFKTVINESRF